MYCRLHRHLPLSVYTKYPAERSNEIIFLKNNECFVRLVENIILTNLTQFSSSMGFSFASLI